MTKIKNTDGLVFVLDDNDDHKAEAVIKGFHRGNKIYAYFDDRGDILEYLLSINTLRPTSFTVRHNKFIGERRLKRKITGYVLLQNIKFEGLDGIVCKFEISTDIISNTYHNEVVPLEDIFKANDL